MPRILYWNVRDFSNNKIVNNARPPDAPHGFAGLRQGPARLAFMLNCFSSGTLGGLPFIPDFIVIVEVEKGIRSLGQGNLVAGNAATGITGLLTAIRGHAPLNAAGQNWRLVPPLILGRRGQGEGIAVFYNAASWYFMGPDGWGGNYAPPFNNALPARQIPVGYPLGQGNQWENRLRGRWHFTAQANPLVPPTSIHFPTRNSRQPWLTCFGSVGAPYTFVRLMAMHTSPAFAQGGTAAISQINTMMGNGWHAANQIDVILGDFNVDNLVAAEWAVGGAYSHFVGTAALRNANPVYTPTVRPPAGLAAQYDSYYWTESPTTLANCIVDDGYGNEAGFEPGYGYLVRSIDNIFYRTHGVAAPPANANATIVNRAVGTIYPAAGPPVPVPAPYRGTVTYAPMMNTPMANILGNVGHMINDANEELQEWDNYGLIQSTSDHLPLVAQI